MLQYFVAAVCCFQFLLLFLLIGRLWPGRPLPGIRIFLWFMGISSAICLSVSALFLLPGRVAQPVMVYFYLLIWYSLSLTVPVFALDLQGQALRWRAPFRNQRLKLAGSLLVFILLVMVGIIWFRGGSFLLSLAWLTGAVIFV